MGRYIKSYSNYVLKKKHQTVNDGVIYEIYVSNIVMACRLQIKRMIFYNYYAQTNKENY